MVVDLLAQQRPGSMWVPLGGVAEGAAGLRAGEGRVQSRHGRAERTGCEKSKPVSEYRTRVTSFS